MDALTHAVLATETQLPMTVVGWGALILSLLVAVVWTVYVYR